MSERGTPGEPLVAEPRIAAWDRHVDWWLTALALVFLVAYSWSVLDTTMGQALDDTVEVVLTIVWALFGLDYLVRVVLARRRAWFVLTHVLDLVVLVLPMFRPLRVLRLVAVLEILNRQLRDDVRGRVLVYVSSTVVLIGFVASLAVYDAERGAPDTTITSFGDAVWWAITTISTVGYGDRYPVTFEGRLVGASLMVAGIALLGVITASIASWFVESLRASSQETAAEVASGTGAVLDEVLAELRAISARLDALERARRSS